MKEVLENSTFPTASDKASLAGTKIEWISNLSQAKVLITSSTETPIFFGTRRVSPAQMNQKFARAGSTYIELQEYIQDRREQGIEGDQVLQIANEGLRSFILGPLALFNPSARASAISSLQSIRRLLTLQISNDVKERNIARRFIREVEAVPIFNTFILPA